MENSFLISYKIIILIGIVATIILIDFFKKATLDKNKGKVAFLIYCNFIVNLCFLYYLQNFILIEHLLMGIILIFGLINIILLKLFHLYNEKIKNIFTMFLIIVVQLGYVLYSPYYIRQHDSRSFIQYQYGGHFGYIGYIFFNKSLPTGSPLDYWCFSNPPLFHIISAIFLKVQGIFQGITLDDCFENLQLLSFVYATIFNVYVYRILKEMNIKKSISYILAFVALSPAMVIMSGSINNDMLCFSLSTMAIFYTIKWYKEDNLKNLIKIAFSIGFAMMTKINAALIAIPIAFVFLIKVIQNKENLKMYIRNFAIFAIISLPIGLWFPIKNLVLYDVPITYVQSVEKEHPSNVSRYSILQRFFTISKENLKTINVVMDGENADYNLYLTTIKSFIVDEYMDYENNSLMKISVYTIFIIAVILTILFIIDVIYIIRNYKNINNHWMIFFAGIFILTVISYIKFCFDYPFVFTMNFRYIVPTLVSYSVLIGTSCENNKKLFYLNSFAISIFCISSVVLFLNIV